MKKSVKVVLLILIIGIIACFVLFAISHKELFFTNHERKPKEIKQLVGTTYTFDKDLIFTVDKKEMVNITDNTVEFIKKGVVVITTTTKLGIEQKYIFTIDGEDEEEPPKEEPPKEDPPEEEPPKEEEPQEEPPKEEEPKQEITKVTLNKTKTTITVGSEEKLTATITPSSLKNSPLTWTSSDTSIVTVNNGKIKGVKVGTATITVESNNGKKATCTVTVIKKDTTIPVSKITLNKLALKMGIGAEEKLIAYINPSNATNQHLTWTSSDPSVVSVTGDGAVKALKAGRSTITVKSNNGKTAICNILVEEDRIPVTSITLNKDVTTLKVGETEKITVTINPSNATNKNYYWSIDDRSVVSITNGVLKGLQAGTTYVTVVGDGNKMDTLLVVVTDTDIEVTKILLNKTSLTLKENETFQLEASVLPSNATNQTISWSSSNKNIVSVDKGKITAVSEGEATITVKASNGVKNTCKVKVEK